MEQRRSASNIEETPLPGGQAERREKFEDAEKKRKKLWVLCVSAVGFGLLRCRAVLSSCCPLENCEDFFHRAPPREGFSPFEACMCPYFSPAFVREQIAHGVEPLIFVCWGKQDGGSLGDFRKRARAGADYRYPAGHGFEYR